MKIVYSKNSESFKKTGIHIYDFTLLKKVVIPYTQGKLRLTRTVYVHNIETDKQWEVVENAENKQTMEKILTKVFSKEYIEKPVKRWIKPVVKEEPKRVVPTYELDEEQWKKPKKKGGMNKWT